MRPLSVEATPQKRQNAFLSARSLLRAGTFAFGFFLLLFMPVREVLAEGPALSEATSSIVMDEKGNVLFEHNANNPLAPASITKIMTAMVALDSGISLDTPVTIRKVDFPDWPSAQLASLPENATITFGDLLKVMLVYSANDCAVMVAETVAGSEAAFTELMDKKAQELGMSSSNFENTHGLETAPTHLSCAHDLALMGRYALVHYPFIATWVSTEEVNVNVGGETFTFHSTDQLLGTYPGAMGIKTGTVDSGITFLGAVRQLNTTLYSVVMGCRTSEGRWADTRALWDWSYETYEHRVVAAPTIVECRFRFPLRFGWDICATAPEEVVGLVWPNGGALEVTRAFVPKESELTGGEIVGVGRWSQKNRPVIACLFKADRLEKSEPMSLNARWLGFVLHGIEV